MFISPEQEVVYVGKSKSLGKRIPGSLKERISKKNIAYISYAITDTKADMEIYEKYYINELKPVLNSADKFEDFPTIEFPPLKFVKPIKVKASLTLNGKPIERFYDLVDWSPLPPTDNPEDYHGHDADKYLELKKIKEELIKTKEELAKTNKALKSELYFEKNIKEVWDEYKQENWLSLRYFKRHCEILEDIVERQTLELDNFNTAMFSLKKIIENPDLDIDSLDSLGIRMVDWQFLDEKLGLLGLQNKKENFIKERKRLGVTKTKTSA
jgi:hypothetical protein